MFGVSDTGWRSPFIFPNLLDGIQVSRPEHIFDVLLLLLLCIGTGQITAAECMCLKILVRSPQLALPFQLSFTCAKAKKCWIGLMVR